jgi:hypothetical protein
MEYKKGILAILFLLLMLGCKRDWESHYASVPVTSNINVWAAMQSDKDLTQFVQFIKDYHYDTLFNSQNTYTIFAPTNAALTLFLSTPDTFGRTLVNYQIVTSFVQSGNISGARKVQTMSKKFALFLNLGGVLSVDGIPVSYESPVYKNGKYFKMGKVDKPRPSLYQYFGITNPILKTYIDSKDSVILDKTLSRPIGFDSHGNTIYDTVSFIYNSFEDKFFPTRKEFRDQFATIVFPLEKDYNAALTIVAQSLNLPSYHDYHDIPLSWQNKILIPYLLEHGIFPNLVEAAEFSKFTSGDTIKLKNILGDSIKIDYKVALPTDSTPSPYVCSNGYAYNYKDFRVPDTLYGATTRFEAEKLVSNTGANTYAWKSTVQVTSNFTFSPIKDFSPTASNDTVIRVNFTKKYTGVYTITFNIDNLFPRKYLMTVRTYTNLGGIYKIYVNGALVKTFDYYSYLLNSGSYTSVAPPFRKYKTIGGYNIFDCWINPGILTEYGKAAITFEYTGPSLVQSNGLSIDYIGFTPY